MDWKLIMKPILSVGDKKSPKIIADRLKALRPDPIGDVKKAKGIMDIIVNELKTKDPFNKTNIQMAGSLKKNTMLTSRNELDIVVSLPINLRKSYPPTLNTRKALQSQIVKLYNVDEPKVNQQNVIIEKKGWKIDILPTFSIEITDFLKKTEKEKQVYKPYMSLLHIDFVMKRGQKYQEFCRLVKYWTNGPQYISDRFPYTSSWFIELIAASVYDVCDSTLNLLQLFDCFLRRIRNMKRKKIYMAFSDYYNKEQFRDKWRGKLAVIEPTNPNDNIAERGYQSKNMTQLVKRAKETIGIWEEKGFNQVFQNYFSRQPD